MTDRIETLFAHRGLRCTRQRRALYEALATSRAHPTADELHRLANQRMRGISLATVYNALEAFCEAGLVQKLPGAGTNGSSRYDALREEHLHMRCQNTGAVADVPPDVSRQIRECISPQVLREIEQRLGFEVDQVQIELVGRYKAEPCRQMRSA